MEGCLPPRATVKKKRIPDRKFRIMIGGLAVAVVLLAGTSISYWWLADHYHDSKYRAQYVLVYSVTNSILHASSDLADMADITNSDQERVEAGWIGHDRIDASCDSFDALAAMYPKGSTEWQAFYTIRDLLAWITDEIVDDYEYAMADAMRENESYVANDTITFLFKDLRDRMTSISDIMRSGIDPTRDWYRDPYSLVNRIDLAALNSARDALHDVSLQLNHLVPDYYG